MDAGVKKENEDDNHDDFDDGNGKDGGDDDDDDADDDKNDDEDRNGVDEMSRLPAAIAQSTRRRTKMKFSRRLWLRISMLEGAVVPRFGRAS